MYRAKAIEIVQERTNYVDKEGVTRCGFCGAEPMSNGLHLQHRLTCPIAWLVGESKGNHLSLTCKTCSYDWKIPNEHYSDMCCHRCLSIPTERVTGARHFASFKAADIVILHETFPLKAISGGINKDGLMPVINASKLDEKETLILDQDVGFCPPQFIRFATEEETRWHDEEERRKREARTVTHALTST